MTSTTRLFVTDSLEKNKKISITEKPYNYLINVMRRKVGDKVLLINGKDGEFEAEIKQIGKKSCELEILQKTRKFVTPKNLCLAFSLIKRIEVIAEKGTELGVTEFFPLVTQRTIISKFNRDKFKSNVIEAVEQSERLDVPDVKDAVKLKKFLESFNKNDVLIFCEERSDTDITAISQLNKIKQELKSDGKIYVLVGPEGGFSEEEMKLINGFNNTYSISLGDRILRAETATIVSLGLVNEVLLR